MSQGKASDRAARTAASYPTDRIIRPLDDTLQAFRAKSGVFYDVAEPWLEVAFDYVLSHNGRSAVRIMLASDREDIHEATDYNVVRTSTATGRAAFRGRDIAKCYVGGRPIRQMTLRKAGRVTEHHKVLVGGFGDYYVTVWCDGPDFVAGIVVDLAALRALPPVNRGRLEHEAMSNVPFVGYDAAALIAYDMVPVAFPDEDYFAAFTEPPRYPGQEALL